MQLTLRLQVPKEKAPIRIEQAAVDSVAAVAVVPVESAIAGKRLTLIEQAKGCHESMAPFFCLFFANTSGGFHNSGSVVQGREGPRVSFPIFLHSLLSRMSPDVSSHGYPQSPLIRRRHRQ
jgi:hypothetical protein